MAQTAMPTSSASSNGSEGTNYTVPLATMASLMFMIGFITCLNDILLPHLKIIFDLSYAQASLIQLAFFFGYFFAAIPSGKIISMFGYKKGTAIGLCTSGIGALMFFPAAAIPSYEFFLVALFTMAAGFALLQVAINPYVAVLGKAETSSARLVLVQAFNSVGTFIAPYFGTVLILAGATLSGEQLRALAAPEAAMYKAQQAASVQMPYVGLAIALLVLGVIVLMLHLPSISSVEGEAERSTTYGQALKQRHLVLGVIGIFAYVGGEVAIGSYLINFLGLPEIAGMKEAAAAAYVPYYWGGAMVGRFIGSFLLTRVKPGLLLAVQAGLAFGLVAISVMSSGSTAMWSVILVGLMNSIMFATIFTLAIKDLGVLTNKGGSLLNMAIVGGAVVPYIQGLLADSMGLHQAFVIPLACYAYIVYYGLSGSKVRSAGA
jgi:FHS family L-fucose permease-like MFS transporter